MPEPLRKLVPSERGEAPETARTPQIAPVAPVEERSRRAGTAAAKGPRMRRRDHVRWILFALLPLAFPVAIMSHDTLALPLDRLAMGPVAVTQKSR